MKNYEIMENNDYSLRIEDPKPNSIIFSTDGVWVMKIASEGIFFNREKFSSHNPDDFAKAVIDILEKGFFVTFNKKQLP